MLDSGRRPALTTEPVYAIRELGRRHSAGGGAFELWIPSLTLRAGEIIALKGTSGSGKSTLLDLLALVLQPDRAGVFRFAPRDGTGIDAADLWRGGRLDELGWQRAAHIGYVLQTGGLLPFLTVRENIDLPCRLLGRPTVRTLLDLVERLDIVRQLDKYPAQLSVGERQRVAIARALVHRPSVVLADEPTASVDPLNAAVIMELLLELVNRFGITTVIASHDWESIKGLVTLEFRLERAEALTRAVVWN